MANIPTEPSGYTPEWFTEALTPHLAEDQILSCRVEPYGAPGQTAEILSAQLTYESGSSILPARLVIKTTSRDPQVIELINTFDQYRRETAFYSQQTDLAIPTPRCYFSSHDPETQHFVLLLEDLAPSVSPSWAIAPDQVQLAVHHLAPFHARWWNDPGLERQDWLVQQSDNEFYAAFFGGAAAGIDAVRASFGSEVEYSEALANRVLEKTSTILDYFLTRHHTLVHGDYHGKQMFFPTNDGGRFAVIDWQFPFRAQGPWDLARIVQLGLEPSARRKLEPELITRYLTGLATAGVGDYDRQDFEDDYRIGIAVSQLIMMIAVAQTDPAIIDAECAALDLDWKDVSLRRGDQHLRDWEVLDLIERI